MHELQAAIPAPAPILEAEAGDREVVLAPPDSDAQDEAAA